MIRRLRAAWRAFNRQDVIWEAGLQRQVPDPHGDLGPLEVETLAKMVFAVWVRTEDWEVAQGELARRLVEGFGPIEWDEAAHV